VEGSSQIAIATQEISRMSEEIAELMFKEKEIVTYVNNKTGYVGELSGDMKNLISLQNTRTDTLLKHMKEMGEKTRKIFSMSEDLSINNKKILTSIQKIKQISDNNYKNSSLLYKTSISLKKYSNYLNSEFKDFRTLSKYYGGTLRISGLRIDCNTLDPIHSFKVDESQVLSMIFSGLVKYDRLFNLVPDIAKEWTVSQDGLSYVFKLKQNVVFHNGQQLTASDVEATFRRLLDAEFGSPAAGTYFIIKGAEDFNKGRVGNIEGIEVIDDYTIKFILEKPLVFFIDLLALINAYILPQTEYIKKDKKRFSAIGTGPFELVEYEPGVTLSLKKNADYHIDGKPFVDRVVMDLSNNRERFKQFKQGEIDIVPLFDADDIAVAANDSQLKDSVITATQFATYFLAFNCKKPPFDNAHFRTALSFAIDRGEICQKFPLKLAEPAYSVIPPGMAGHMESGTLTDYDPEKAKWLLENYNFDFNTPVEITFAQHGEELPPDIQVIAENFKAIGLNVSLNGMQNHWSYINEKQHSMFRVGWIADYPDPDNFMYTIFNSNFGDPFVTGFRNKEMEELTEKARFMLDPRERLLLYEQLEKIHARFSPLIPLYHKKDALLKNIYLSDVVLNSFAPSVDMADISFNTIY
jgi:peptide/nickel transport system substrate-binding protein/oligopeptide transport system substrate-binding protein